jgi:D-3-phosphoglycerate dehydrogenase / 2-oxoglutarate reductase
MSAPRVYVALRQFCQTGDAPRQILREAGLDVRENTSGRVLRREEMPAILQETDAVLAGLEPYDGALFASLPRLRCVSRCGVGTDAIDLDAARQRGVTVYTTADEVAGPVAQLTLAMILALARDIPHHLGALRRGVWKRRVGALLSEWTIGLVGFGRIGRAVERYLRPFGARVLVADPHLDPGKLPHGVEHVALDALLEQADLVSLHAGRAKSEGPLIRSRELSRMKVGSRLVNTSRGFLVDERALHEALTSGQLAGAALDVFETEPYTGPLAQLPQVLCTPHVASMTHASRAAMEQRCAQHVVEHLARAQTTFVGSAQGKPHGA